MPKWTDSDKRFTVERGTESLARTRERMEARQPATHFAGCWRLHHQCAIAEIERLETARNDAAGQLYEMAMTLERAEKAAATWKQAAKKLWNARANT